MPYYLEANESNIDGVRRLIIECIDQNIVELTILPEGRDEAIHNSRKNFKRIRAALRLVRDEIGEEIYKRENLRFRDASRKLSRARDSWVLVQTYNEIIKKYGDQPLRVRFESIPQSLTRNYEQILAEDLNDHQLMPQIIDTMKDAKICIQGFPAFREGFSAFQGGVRRVYFRGQRAMHKAYLHTNPENFHEWRKRTKYLWHLIEILVNTQPNVLENLANDLHDLSDYLGIDHDLAVLLSVISTKFKGAETEPGFLALIQLIEKERLEVETLARDLGDRLYFDSPEDFTRQLGVYWNSWRELKKKQIDLESIRKFSDEILPRQ